MRIALLLLTVLMVLVTQAPDRQSAQAVVTPEQASYAIAPGTETIISIFLQDASNVYGIDVQASFDPALVEVIDADAASEGIQVEPGQFPRPDFIAVNNVEPQAGTLRYVVTQINPTPPANGSGLLFTVRLRGKGVAGQGSFVIENVEMSDRNGNLLPVSGGSAALVISGSSEAASPAAATGVAIAPTSAAPAQPTATSLPTIPNTSATAVPTQPVVTASATEESTVGSGMTPIATLAQEQTVPPPATTAAPGTADVEQQPADQKPNETAQPELAVADAGAEVDSAAGSASTPMPSAIEEPEDRIVANSVATSEPEPQPDIAVIGDSQAMTQPPEIQSVVATDVASERKLTWPIAIGIVAVLAIVAAILLIARRSY